VIAKTLTATSSQREIKGEKEKERDERRSDNTKREKKRGGIREAFNTTEGKTMSESFTSFHTLQL
jgi:hypothetical protein